MKINHSGTYEFFGVSTSGPYEIAEHKAKIWIGVLCSGLVLDPELFEKNRPDWDGSLEMTLNAYRFYIDECMKNKGLLIVGVEEIFGVRAAVVTNEVLRDADVKEEMYRLMQL